MKPKGTLPLVWKYLSKAERKIYEPFINALDENVEFEELKFGSANGQKVKVKQTLPLVADFLGVSEGKIKEIIDLDTTIPAKKALNQK